VTALAASTLHAAEALPAMPAPLDSSAPPATSLQHLSGTFLRAAMVDIVALLPPPPAANSPAQAADLAAVVRAQRTARAAGTLQRAVDDAQMSCARLQDVLGPELQSAAAREALRTIQAGAAAVSGVVQPAKMYWKRPRPFIVSKEVTPLADMALGVNRAQRNERSSPSYVRDHTSYPSGHSTFGMACGLLLAQAIPERRAELIARGRLYGESRMIVGAHFPTDVLAGQVSATLGVALLLQNASFLQQFQEARTRLRAALGFPAALPDLEPEKELFRAPPVISAVPAQ
jgi:acid phosphatase (class A)